MRASLFDQVLVKLGARVVSISDILVNIPLTLIFFPFKFTSTFLGPILCL